MTPRFRQFLALLSLLSLNALAAAPIVLAPTGGGEPLTPDRRGAVPQGTPSVASDGNGWFAVWADSRYGNGDVFGTGVSPAGEPIHPEGIPISPTYAPDGDPQIVWTGDRYFAAFISPIGVLTSRFAPDATHLGSNLSIPASGPNAYAPTFARGTWLAWNGDRALVAWYQWGGPDEIRVALLDRDGAMIAGPISIASGPREVSLSVTTSREGFLLAWESPENGMVTLHTIAISANGTKSAIHTIASFAARTLLSQPVIGSRNEVQILLWNEGHRLRGARLASSGEPLEPPFTVLETEDVAWSPDDLVESERGWFAAVSGGSFIAGTDGIPRWDPDAFLLRLGGDGRAEGAPVRAGDAAGSRKEPAISLNADGRLFVVWEENRQARGRVFDAETLAPLAPPRALGLGLTNQTTPTLTPHGAQRYLLSWYEGGGRLAIVDASGKLQGPILSFERTPVIASNGAIALVAWTEWPIVEGKYVPHALGMRLGEDGIPLEKEFVIAEGSAVSSVATDGLAFMVVLREQRYLPSIPYIPDDQLWTVSISSAGGVGERHDIPRVQDDWFRHEASAIAWTGEHYLVVWNERHPCIAGHCVSDLYAIPVAASGIPLASEGIVVTGTLSRFDEVPVSLACSGSDCALVLIQLNTRVIRLSVNGERLDGPVTDPGLSVQRFDDPYSGPWSVAWDGSRYIVGGGALAPLASGEVLRVFERTWIPLPLAHEGKITRLYVARVMAGRQRVALR